jgi:hypothetical protein
MPLFTRFLSFRFIGTILNFNQSIIDPFPSKSVSAVKSKESISFEVFDIRSREFEEKSRGRNKSLLRCERHQKKQIGTVRGPYTTTLQHTPMHMYRYAWDMHLW